MEDSKLIEDFRAGSRESFEQLVIKYRVNAIYFARQMLNDRAMAEDIAQESFADVYVNRERYNGKSSFKTYLFAVIKHKCIDYMRKKKLEPLDDNLQFDFSTPEDAYLEKEQRQLVRSKLELLKEEYRIVIYLIEYEELSYQEAAKVMGKNLAQIKILVFRARKKLKKLMEQEV